MLIMLGCGSELGGNGCSFLWLVSCSVAFRLIPLDKAVFVRGFGGDGLGEVDSGRIHFRIVACGWVDGVD